MIDDTLREADSNMDKAVEFAKEEFAAIRTGRADIEGHRPASAFEPGDPHSCSRVGGADPAVSPP